MIRSGPGRSGPGWSSVRFGPRRHNLRVFGKIGPDGPIGLKTELEWIPYTTLQADTYRIKGEASLGSFIKVKASNESFTKNQATTLCPLPYVSSFVFIGKEVSTNMSLGCSDGLQGVSYLYNQMGEIVGSVPETNSLSEDLNIKLPKYKKVENTSAPALYVFKQNLQFNLGCETKTDEGLIKSFTFTTNESSSRRPLDSKEKTRHKLRRFSMSEERFTGGLKLMGSVQLWRVQFERSSVGV
nr:hypothetical protein [Tanacetum cinerariifolium]